MEVDRKTATKRMGEWAPDRRSLLVAAAGMLFHAPSAKAASTPIRALAFDAFPIFDPRGISVLAREMFGERGDQLATQWSAKLFGYMWLETAAGRYQDFHNLASGALRHTADAMGLKLSDPEQRRLIERYEELDAWPDVKPALERLHAGGVRLALLSNLGATTLKSNLDRNNLTSFFEATLSADSVRRFKPAPEAYKMAMEAFGLPRDQIGFVAFGGWDAIGATWFGYRTVWINRFGLPREGVDMSPEITSRGIEGALRLAGLS